MAVSSSLTATQIANNKPSANYLHRLLKTLRGRFVYAPNMGVDWRVKDPYRGWLYQLLAKGKGMKEAGG